MSMISDLVDRLRVESKSMGKYGVDYMATLLMQASDTIVMLSEKAKASADRPQGEWKRRLVDNGFNADWVCSECGYRVKTDFVSFNFCPHCGARMKGADDE